MQTGLTKPLDALRQSLNGSICRSERSKIGQFLTPSAIARFMGSLFENKIEEVRILDPGAGTGILFAATVESLTSRQDHPKTIEVVAYENDKQLFPYLKDTMERCDLACSTADISFRGTILSEDFVSAGVVETDGGLLAGPAKTFTHAILNPPYKKINGKSCTRKMLDAAGMEVSNLYAAFVWLASRMLIPGGELVAITPRSFCNGPYFRRFRVSLLELIALRRIHVFESRKKAFGDDGVLQENVIFHGVRAGRKQKDVNVSFSEGNDFVHISPRRVPYQNIVLPRDRDAFLHIALRDADDRIMEQMEMFRTPLAELGIEVSTGRVVDFRAREYLRPMPENRTVPLVYPCHFEEGFVRWPVESGKKPNAIISSGRTQGLLVTSGYYVLTKRFSAKEERRRVVAAICDPSRLDAPMIGFENHLNYYHAKGSSLPPNLAKGLAVYLNSSLFDHYFRLFSGHTQVNATDLRKIRYPSREQLMRLGRRIKQRLPEQDKLDVILKEVCEQDG